MNKLYLIIYKVFTEACRDSSGYLLCPINENIKGHHNFNIVIIFIFSFVFLQMLSSIFLRVTGSVFIYIIKFIIEINTVIKLAHK